MTIIELFDKPSIESIVSALMCKPDRIILFGSKKKLMQKYADIYNRLVYKHTGKDIPFECVSAGRNELEPIVKMLIEILDSGDEYIIDLDGGEDLFLVASGIAYERCNNKPQLHRFNVANNTLYDCDDSNSVAEISDVEISIEDNLNIHGGGIVRKESGNSNYTYEWDFNDEFLDDVSEIWSICKGDTQYWNYFFLTFEKLLEGFGADDLNIYTNDPELIKDLRVRFLEKFSRAGLIKDLYHSDDTIAFTFKSRQVKEALSKAGTALELYTTTCAMEITKDDKPLYNDVMMGVVIDWDNKIHSDDDETEDVQNEIDVILSKGIVPVFVSCKNGQFSCDELYKLNTVAEQFGSKCVKKVLVSTNLSRLPNRQVIRQRAREMKIKIIEDVDEISKGEFLKALKNAWNS